MAGVEVITEDLSNHPECPHGPTILFSKFENGIKKKFFACAACRDRKNCSFFLWEVDRNKISSAKKEVWELEKVKFLKNIDHQKLYAMLKKVCRIPEKPIYCHTCNMFDFDKFITKHVGHKYIINVTEYQLQHPSELLPPLDDAKKEAQFLFSKTSVEVIVNILKNLNYKNVICIGTPRIHEYIQTVCGDMQSLLLDIDDRYHNFYGPSEFCWYNSFNHHFFFDKAKSVFEQFIQSNSGENMVLITDPPFGGRVEPLAQTITTINNKYKTVNNIREDLPVFWVFPYFMEPQIKNSLPDFEMMDYKVEYDNHPLFKDGPKGRKHGSPVRIFTNVDLRSIKLPPEEYKYCKVCEKWVANENNHCNICNSCTSKDGRTYKHCKMCERCVKPSWSHCSQCNRCVVTDHKCGEILFLKDCFHCKKPGHKKRECPEVDQKALFNKRKKSTKAKNVNKKRKC